MPVIRRKKIAIRGNNSRTEALNNGLFCECVFFGIESSPFFWFFLFRSFSFYFDIRYFIYASKRFIGRLCVPMCNVKSHTHAHIVSNIRNFRPQRSDALCCMYGAIAIVSIIAGKSTECVQKKRRRMRTRSLVWLYDAMVLCAVHSVFYTWQIVVPS